MRGTRPSTHWCIGLAEYRLDDLARISGVSSRNIRAYRERGLLDPPRRQGRSAFYDDYHLSQLKTINQLLRKGFNSAHIAEFFARMREGHDLAAILGVQQAILGRRAEDPRTAGRGPGSRSRMRRGPTAGVVRAGRAHRRQRCARSSGDGRDRHALGRSTPVRSDDSAGVRIDHRHDRRVGGHPRHRAGGVHRRPLRARLRPEAE